MGALNQPGFCLVCCGLGRPSCGMACLILGFLKAFSRVLRPLWGYDSSSQVCLCVCVRLKKLTVIRTCLICVLCAVRSTIQCLSLSVLKAQGSTACACQGSVHSGTFLCVAAKNTLPGLCPWSLTLEHELLRTSRYEGRASSRGAVKLAWGCGGR